MFVIGIVGCGGDGSTKLLLTVTSTSFSTNEDTAHQGSLIYSTNKNGSVSLLIDSPPLHGVLEASLNGQFTYTPNKNYSGSDSFTFKAKSLKEDYTSQPATIYITVEPVNDPPTNNITNFSINENSKMIGNVDANDVDSVSLIYNISGGEDSHLIKIDSDSGLLEFKNAPNFENPADQNIDNIYEIDLTIKDESNSIEANIEIAVLNLTGWYKGNTHTHTEYSYDSETPQEDLMAWYKRNNYNFVVVTDHNYFSELGLLNSLSFNSIPIVDDAFILIPGEEITAKSNHVGGINISYLIEPSEEIWQNFNSVISANGLPQLNHPYRQRITSTEIVKGVQGFDVPLFIEVFNSKTDFIDGTNRIPQEILWDEVLSAGIKMWGVAVDDSHYLNNVGGGFIVVDADNLTIARIVEALNEGRFYASTGKLITNFSYNKFKYFVDATSDSIIQFIGRNGEILKEFNGSIAEYEFAGDEYYVRAKVISDSGVAWLPPFYLNESNVIN